MVHDGGGYDDQDDDEKEFSFNLLIHFLGAQTFLLDYKSFTGLMAFPFCPVHLDRFMIPLASKPYHSLVCGLILVQYHYVSSV